LPLEIQVDKYKLFYVRKNSKGAYEIIFIITNYWTVPDNIIATDSNEILATACIIGSGEAKLVTLNKLKEIKIYQDASMIQRFYMNFSLKSLDQGIPLIFPQFYFNLPRLKCNFQRTRLFCLRPQRRR